MIHLIDGIQKPLRPKSLPQTFHRIGIHRSKISFVNALGHGYAFFTSGNVADCCRWT
jgi:hypothetical protein